jgi:hypothetical protein
MLSLITSRIAAAPAADRRNFPPGQAWPRTLDIPFLPFLVNGPGPGLSISTFPIPGSNGLIVKKTVWSQIFVLFILKKIEEFRTESRPSSQKVRHATQVRRIETGHATPAQGTLFTWFSKST